MPRHIDRSRRPAQRVTPGTPSRITSPAAPDSLQARANEATRTLARSVQLRPAESVSQAPGVVQRKVKLSTAGWGPSKGKWVTTLDTTVYFDTEQEARAHEAACRKAERRRRRERVTPAELPQPHQGKQTRFPSVVSADDHKPAKLVYRGMSINNVRNLTTGSEAVFTSQAPEGTATPLEHVVDDSQDSPWLSFEAGGLDVSAGKYAPKPVDPDTRKPLGVERKPGGFLKQEKSYTAKSRRDHPTAKRIGYVGGITPDAGSERLNVSDERHARHVFAATPDETQERRQKAIDLAKADREVLVKPGVGGIEAAKVPFVSKVKEVDEAYYRKHVARQTPSKTVGYYKAFGEDATYVKMQIPPSHPGYKFGVPRDLLREDDDSESEMSDIEDPDLSDYT